MAQYVDGFVIPLPKDKIEEYRKIAEVAEVVWREHGALDYRECVGDDLDVSFGTPFPKMLGLQADETVVFAFITYPSREDRDRINAAVIADPRLKCDPETMPFDTSRMSTGGFRTIVGS